MFTRSLQRVAQVRELDLEAPVEAPGRALDDAPPEADGGVRSMITYEGTVGNILSDPPDVLWQRVLERRRHPFALKVLGSLHTMQDWAAASRQMDWHFGSDESRSRIQLRTRAASAPEPERRE